MRKRKYRYFGGLLNAQERWLNRMAASGLRLVGTGKLSYEFEPCSPGQVEYRVDFVGNRSKDYAKDYRAFLDELGYRVYFKNLNLNFSIGKVRLRPWAKKGGRVATNRTTFNRELLIVEKEADGTPFLLHTSLADKRQYYQGLRDPWAFTAALFLLLGLWAGVVPLAVFGLVCLVPALVYQVQISALKKEEKLKEF